ncbi:hypothetical protein KQI45_00140 [Clostridium sporogenes]|uniref:hypothetical protein n=1 Tax=Clostridium sporogenes TaxID=1509 RepID=UPI0013D25A01|nr:hypothetical protein [Clostridium sporogenes]MBU5298485.1 hypothetical protein [Clostridium sporogenes]
MGKLKFKDIELFVAIVPLFLKIRRFSVMDIVKTKVLHKVHLSMDKLLKKYNILGGK